MNLRHKSERMLNECSRLNRFFACYSHRELSCRSCRSKHEGPVLSAEKNGPYRGRTYDRLVKSQLLYQLS